MTKRILGYICVLIFASAMLVGCRSNVPPGGACSSNGECGEASAACYFPEGSEEGYCTRSCRIDEQTETKPCPDGLTCKRHDTEHFILGATFCSK